MPRRPRKPSYTLHKSTGQARVRIGSTDYYLGTHGTQESYDRYEKLMGELFLTQQIEPAKLTVGELTVQFIRFADEYYRRDGVPTGEANNFRQALRILNSLFRATPVREFGPKKLLHVRNRMIEKGMVRTSINIHIARIKHLFKWGVAQELVPPHVQTAIAAVAGLRRDRSGAAEPIPVLPVPEEDVEAVRAFLTAPVWAMVQLQLFSGMRPNEVRLMRVGAIDRSGPVWAYVPRHHKTMHHGRQRTIFLGPKAQMILLPFLTDRPELFVFRLQEGRNEFVSENYSQGSRAAVRNSSGGNAPYTHRGYDSSIRKACKRAGVPLWSPGRLRHNAATNIRREFGDIEAARTVLGHSTQSMTQRYAELDLNAARAVISRIG